MKTAKEGAVGCLDGFMIPPRPRSTPREGQIRIDAEPQEKEGRPFQEHTTCQALEGCLEILNVQGKAGYLPKYKENPYHEGCLKKDNRVLVCQRKTTHKCAKSNIIHGFESCKSNRQIQEKTRKEIIHGKHFTANSVHPYPRRKRVNPLEQVSVSC